MNTPEPRPETFNDKEPEKLLNRRVHMANERTFLAWIRTSIGIMAFGFVVQKFALFTKQMALILGRPATDETLLPDHGYSALMGIFLVALGAVMSALAFVKYMKVKKQIDEDTWHHSSALNALLTFAILAVGIILVIYLISTN